jgi:hypothetical protein
MQNNNEDTMMGGAIMNRALLAWAGLFALCPTVSAFGESAETTQPIVLTAEQMDIVTAGGISSLLDMKAQATGIIASTATAADLQAVASGDTRSFSGFGRADATGDSRASTEGVGMGATDDLLFLATLGGQGDGGSDAGSSTSFGISGVEAPSLNQIGSTGTTVATGNEATTFTTADVTANGVRLVARTINRAAETQHGVVLVTSVDIGVQAAPRPSPPAGGSSPPLSDSAPAPTLLIGIFKEPTVRWNGDWSGQAARISY